MKYCRKCGTQINDGQNVCTQCGTPVEVKTTSTKQPEHVKTPTVQKSPRKPMSKRNKIIIGSIILLLILLFTVYKVLQNHYAPENIANTIVNAIEADDTKELSHLVEVHGKDMTADDANAFIKYVKDDVELTTFKSNVLNTINNRSEQSHVTDIYFDGGTIMSMSQNGKHLGLFNKYEFSVPTYSVYDTQNDGLEVTYQYNGKNHKYKANGESIGKFPIGIYNLKATKEVDEQKIDGDIKFTVRGGSNVEAESHFKEAYLYVTTKGDYDLENIKIFVNSKEIEHEQYNIGPYPDGETLTVYAEGNVGSKTFKSSEEKVELDGKDNEVTLEFDANMISAESRLKSEKDYARSSEQSERNTIDLYSESFKSEFMRKNHVEGFREISLGMSKADVEEKLGESDGVVDSSFDEFLQYNDIGIEYDKNKVKKVYILGDNYMDLDDFVKEYGKYTYNETLDNGKKRYYFDFDRTNGFVIVGQFKSNGFLEYIYQKPEEATDPWAK